eukprot:gene14430-15935_t
MADRAGPSCSGDDKKVAVRKSRRKKSIDELMAEAEKVMNKLKPPKIPKQPKSHTKVSSIDPVTGRRNRHSVRHNRKKKTQKKLSTSNANQMTNQAPGNPDNDEFDADDVWEDIADDSEDFSHLDLQNLITECHDLLKTYHVEKPEKTEWEQREEESQAKWEAIRQNIFVSILDTVFMDDGQMCMECESNKAFIKCPDCKSIEFLCGACDKERHSQQPFHDRLLWADGSFRYLNTLESVNESGSVINIDKVLDMKMPICRCGNFKRFIVNTKPKKCIVVNKAGRFDLRKFDLTCMDCMEIYNPFTVECIVKSGTRTKPYYGDAFIYDDAEVDAVMQSLYDDPNVKKIQPDNFCGTSTWKAASNKTRKFTKLDETGLEVASCRHRIAQKAVNMFRGEIFGYAYYIQKNFFAHRHLSYVYSDVACKYSKWLKKVDADLLSNTECVLGMMHAKGHPPECEILFGGLWSNGSGYTAGEEDEQIFSYLSRIGSTTKYMLPEGRNEVITEHVLAWNRRKIRKLAEDLFKRFKQTYQKKTKVETELQVKLAEHGISNDRSMFMEWKRNAVFNAKVCSNMATPVQLSKDEELLLLFMVLSEKGKLPQQTEHVCGNVQPISLKVDSLKVPCLSKSSEKMQAAYIQRNNEASSFSDDVKQSLNLKVMSIHEQHIEATANLIHHMGVNLNKLADSSKKRRKIRVKMSQHKESLSALIKDYNANCRSLCKSVNLTEDMCYSGNYPWKVVNAITDKVNVPSDVRHVLLVLHITIERLNEELLLVNKEMKLYMSYYKNNLLPKLERACQQMQEEESNDDESYLMDKVGLPTETATVSSFVEQRYFTEKTSPAIVAGKLALIKSGMLFCAKQLALGSSWFSLCPDVEHVILPDLSSGDSSATIEASENDDESSDDEIMDAELPI